MMPGIPVPDQIGLTTRPKQRALDKILSNQRDKEQAQAQNVGASMGAIESGITRPDTLAMLLGAGR